MKKYLLILVVLFATSANAQEKSIFDMFRDLGSTECESLLREGDTYTSVALKAASTEEWDAAFYHSEAAFHVYLKAKFGYCNEEPENQNVATERLKENQMLDKKLTCQYHTVEAHHASVRAQLALKHWTAKIALKHSRDSVTSIDEALRFCAFDPQRIKDLTEVRVIGIKALALIEDQINLEEE